MFLLRLERFQKLLRVIKFKEEKVDVILNSIEGTLRMECETEEGELIVITWRYEISHEHGLVGLEPILEIPDLPAGVTEEKIRQVLNDARERVRAYGARYSSAEKMRYLEEWLYTRLYQKVSEKPTKEFATLDKYMSGATDVRELELSQLSSRGITRYGTQLHLPPVVLTLAYCWEAEQDLKLGFYDKAWYWAERAQRWSSDDALPPDPNQKTINRASAAGNARSEHHFGPLKRKIKQILASAPSSWLKNMSTAARYVTDEEHGNAWQHYQPSKIGGTGKSDAYLNWESFERTVYSWIREDPELRQIVQASKLAK